MIAPLLDSDGVRRLREALLGADYTAGGVAKRLDARTAATLRAGDAGLVRLGLTGGDPLATLVRLFLAGGVEPEPAVAATGLPVAAALAAGLLVRRDAGLAAAVEIQPYEDAWVVADLPARGAPLAGDHVLGVGGASTTLALATVREPVGAALDIGTGCGVQALHLSRHADAVTATDVSERALRFAATTAALAGLDWELLAGDLVAPVAGRRYDLVVSNPPFIVGPARRRTVTYRDSGRAGDAVCAELVAAAPGLLNPGGYAQFLANWAHPAGGDWAERVAGWLAGTGLDAWIVQREVTDPVEYVRLWQADTARDDPAEAAAWLDWFDAQRVEAVGFGIVTLRAGGHADPAVRVEDLPQALDVPFGSLVPEWFARADWLRAHPDLLAERLRLADSVALHQESRPGPDGWQVHARTLALDAGARWVTETDELTATLLAGCTGGLPLADVVGLLAAASGLDERELAAAVVPVAADLVKRGILLPA